MRVSFHSRQQFYISHSAQTHPPNHPTAAPSLLLPYSFCGLWKSCQRSIPCVSISNKPDRRMILSFLGFGIPIQRSRVLSRALYMWIGAAAWWQHVKTSGFLAPVKPQWLDDRYLARAETLGGLQEGELRDWSNLINKHRLNIAYVRAVVTWVYSSVESDNWSSVPSSWCIHELPWINTFADFFWGLSYSDLERPDLVAAHWWRIVGYSRVLSDHGCGLYAWRRG